MHTIITNTHRHLMCQFSQISPYKLIAIIKQIEYLLSSEARHLLNGLVLFLRGLSAFAFLSSPLTFICGIHFSHSMNEKYTEDSSRFQITNEHT